MGSNITLEEITKELGLSTTTVSMTINDKANVDEKTKQGIPKKAKVLKDLKTSSQVEITLENNFLEVKISPRLGGKITDIIDKDSGTQFLKQASHVVSDIKEPEYGQSFLPPYAAGFDECFPTVTECRIDTNGVSLSYPDHGELWSQSWDHEILDDKVILSVRGKNMDYTFKKVLSISGYSLNIKYEVKNNDEKPLKYLWSSHPLLSIDAGDEILLPSDIEQLEVYYSNDEVLHEKNRADWPLLIEGKPSFAKVLPEESGFAAKLFADKLKTGMAGLYRHKADKTICFKFDENEIPALGIWLCYSAWPEGSAQKDYTLALEPTSHNEDSLKEVITDSKEDILGPGESKTWSLEICIEDGKKEI